MSRCQQRILTYSMGATMLLSVKFPSTNRNRNFIRQFDEIMTKSRQAYIINCVIYDVELGLAHNRENIKNRNKY